MKFFVAALAVLVSCPIAMHADTITVYLGQSQQNYTLKGTGGSNGYATYLAQPGDCTEGPTFTNCVLTGSYNGVSAGYTAGTYTLTTTFATAIGGLMATSTQPVSSPSGGNYFETENPTPDVSISLTLDDVSGTKTLPIVLNGVDSGNAVLVNGTNPTCSGLPQGTPCTQANVGLSTVASVYGPVTGTVIYNFSNPLTPATTPEPGWLAIGGMVPGAIAVLRRRFRRK